MEIPAHPWPTITTFFCCSDTALARNPVLEQVAGLREVCDTKRFCPQIILYTYQIGIQCLMKQKI
jgi:hypothetical protein